VATEGSDVIRDLLIRLGAVVDPDAERTLESFDAAADAVRSTLDNVANAAVTATTALAGIVAGGVAIATGAARNAEAIQRQARALGLTTDEVQELGFAFETFDASSEMMSQTLLVLGNRAQQAQEGATNLVDSFRVLGVSMAEVRALHPAELFERLADGVAAAEDQGKAMSATMRLLGEDVARRMAPLLLEGAEGIRQLREEARLLGVVTDEQTISATAELSLQWRRLLQVGRALRDEIGQVLAPSIERTVDRVLSWVAANRELLSTRLEYFVRGAAEAISLLGPPLAAVTAGLLALRGAFMLAGVAATIAAAPLTPYLLLIGAIVGAISLWVIGLEDLTVWLRGGNSLIGEMLRRWMSVFPLGKELYNLLASIADVGRSVGAAFVQLGGALLRGLGGPVLARIMEALDPFLARLRTIRTVLQAIVGLVNARMGGAAGNLRELATAIDRTAGALAGPVEAATAGAVAQSLDRSIHSTRVDNSRTSLSQQVSISGGADDGSAGFLDALFRQGRESVSGGVR